MIVMLMFFITAGTAGRVQLRSSVCGYDFPLILHCSSLPCPSNFASNTARYAQPRLLPARFLRRAIRDSSS